jgi:hypothetical protein
MIEYPSAESNPAFDVSFRPKDESILKKKGCGALYKAENEIILAGRRTMDIQKRFPLGLIIISVIMFFVALATDIFWIGRWAAHAFPPTMPVPLNVYSAFALPDLWLSVFLYVGAVGLLMLRAWGFWAALIGLGMWQFDSLLVLGITKLTRITIVGPSLIFAIFAAAYLWQKRDLFRQADS